MEFDETVRDMVWEKGRATLEQDATQWRKDECGAWMSRDHYGNPDSEYGWKIENVYPGPADSIEHLRPFHHGNRFDVAFNTPHCRVAADRTDIHPSGGLADSLPRNRWLG